MRDTVDEDQQELASLQEALIASEEQRLEVCRALLDFKMEHNSFLQSSETIQYELQQKIIDLEGSLTQGIVHHVCFLNLARLKQQYLYLHELLIGFSNPKHVYLCEKYK